MVNLIFCAITLFIVHSIPYLIDSKNRKEQESKNMVGWSRGGK